MIAIAHPAELHIASRLSIDCLLLLQILQGSLCPADRFPAARCCKEQPAWYEEPGHGAQEDVLPPGEYEQLVCLVNRTAFVQTCSPTPALHTSVLHCVSHGP
eukprot:GHUV01052503.1.p1 GENE.GHUV01052503.1~~GHUV01052503.1.p1  ORF type:complete len:102 (-),score=20.10 GHUV01052503.1:244-549(-)